jgi:hypothetical protein
VSLPARTTTGEPIAAMDGPSVLLQPGIGHQDTLTPTRDPRLPAPRHATEQLSLEAALERLPTAEVYARKVLARLEIIRPLPPESTSILDIGAAQGRFVTGCIRLGYRAIGIEPWAQARETAAQLAAVTGIDIRILPGTA